MVEDYGVPSNEQTSETCHGHVTAKRIEENLTAFVLASIG
jgi:hypothetical protein